MKKFDRDAGINLYTASQVKAIEQNYAKKFNQDTYPLMQAAGNAAYLHLIKFWPEAQRILIFCGKGNNGGDGFVLARLAAEAGKQVTLCAFSSESRLKGDSAKAFSQLPINGICSVPASEFTQRGLENLGIFDVIVDAMLGTGIQGAVRESFAEVILKINQSGVPVLAVDIPSGVNADTGAVLNCAVKADKTITFVAHKRGLHTGESVNHRGQVALAKLDIPHDCYQINAINVVVENWHSLKRVLLPRLQSAHKGYFGHCMVIGGVTGMSGAMLLAATAAAKCGSGLTSARMQTGSLSLLARCPEIMCFDVELSEIKQQIEALPSITSLVVGPGLGQSNWSNEWMQQLNEIEGLKTRNKVWDADALNWLALNPDVDNNRIITPHPGEAARLLNISIAQINADRFASSLAIAQKYGGVCVLKGAGTVVSDNDGNQVVCDVGNPGMASGGMGDVLSGIIGALLAQGLSLFDAAALGVCIHGEAADRVAGKAKLYRGILASDLFEHFPLLLNP